MSQTLEQRLKQTLGEQVFIIAELQRQLEEAQEKIKQLTPPTEEPAKLHAVE